MSCKKAVDNGVGLEVYTAFDFQPVTLVHLSSFNYNLLNIG